MRRLLTFSLLLASLAGAATIVTVRTAAKVYPTEQRRVYERPIFQLAKGEVVEVLKWGTPLTKIRNRKGRFGWVEPSTLDSLKRPPILNLVIDSEVTAPPTRRDSISGQLPTDLNRPVVLPAKSSEKPVDFQRESTHITARSKADSLK